MQDSNNSQRPMIAKPGGRGSSQGPNDNKVFQNAAHNNIFNDQKENYNAKNFPPQQKGGYQLPPDEDNLFNQNQIVMLNPASTPGAQGANGGLKR